MKSVLRKTLSLLLAVLMAFGVVAVGGRLEAEAISQSDAVAWAKAQGDNRTAFDLNGDYGNGGYQCSDFASAYMNYLMDGNPYSGRYKVYNANYYDTVASWDPTHWEVIQNYAAFLPQPGDIFVSEYGTYGHVGVVISSNTSTAVVVDQNTDSNWNYYTGSPCWKHTITWQGNNAGTYGANWFIRFKGFVNHVCDFKASAKITKAPTKTATGTRVCTCSCGKTKTQTIPAIPYTTDLAEGFYTITTKCKSGLQVATNSDSNYNVFISDGNYADQYWLFRKNSDGTYTIENAIHNGKVLDVEGLSMVNDGNIFAYNYTGADNQKFYVVPSGGYYKLVAKNSYLNVDNYCGGTTSGNNIIQYEENGNIAQLWTLKLNNPSLTCSPASVTVNAGASKTVNCTVGRTVYGITINYSNSNTSVCSVTHASAWSGMTMPLTVTGKAGGTSTITVTLLDSETKIVLGKKTFTVTVPDTTKPTASITATNSVAASQTATLSLSDNVNLAGYYWGTNASYSSNTYATLSGTSKTVTKTVSASGTYYLTAKDAAGYVSSTVSKTFYKTTLNANSGTVSPASVLTMSGNAFALPAPTRTGYTFKNWNTKSDGTGTSYSAGASFKPTGNTTLYAQWTALSYAVTYNANGGTNAPASQTKAYGQPLTLSSTKPTRTGYTFTGWNTKADGTGTSYAPGASYTANAGATLYAQWTAITYTVKYDANGGTGAPAGQTKTYGQPLTLSSTKPTRTGYTFRIWNTEPDDTGTWSYGPGASYTMNADVTLYAQWTPLTYAVKYNANGGSNPPANQTKTYGKTLTLTSITPTRAGYRFTGWNTKADGTGTAYAPASNYASNAALTLYAQWAIDVQSVAIDTAPAQTVYHIGDALNPAGLKLTGTDSAGNTVTITEGFTCKPAVLTARGEQTVTVTYQGKTATFTVRVIGEPEISIRNYYTGSRTEDYKTTIIFTAIPLDPPEGATVHWYLDGRDAGTGERYAVNRATSDYTVQAKLIGADGSVLAESKVETVHIKTNFWSRLVAFFRQIFGLLPVITQTVKETL